MFNFLLMIAILDFFIMIYVYIGTTYKSKNKLKIIKYSFITKKFYSQCFHKNFRLNKCMKNLIRHAIK